MHLTQLLNGICCKVIGNADIVIDSLCCKSSEASPNCMFICLCGGQADGHEYAYKAVESGAIALVVERILPHINVTQVIVSDSRACMALIAKHFYNNAVDKLRVISVIGTNGKTSTTYLASSVFAHAGYITAIVGSNGIFINGQHYITSLTTPDPIELHRYFALMVDMGVKYVFIEVSAHAIYYKKMEGIISTATVFTNFSQDHLDFFGDMEHYASVKKGYFTTAYTRICVINADDALGQKIIFEEKLPCITYGLTCPADVFAINCACDNDGIHYVINLLDDVYKVDYNLQGQFNIYNTLCVSALARVFGIRMEQIYEGILAVRRIEGRNETFIAKNGAKVVVDFAHTPDGFVNILEYLKSITKGKLIVVFGCGGDRDRFKRPLMGKVVSTLADYAILTNDNPRQEPQDQIINEIVCGLTIEHNIVYDRKSAILQALDMANDGDTVAILGKGAESYQEISGDKIPYSDIDTVQSLISADINKG
ncbi:MAG: UDP-N-acetylmuramoyl-L-alanyl-D-glutamate--2,6-diaminopimelate ligase [Clostridia bacterium]|nr:UDP-N-acetylmuramoyl-L-alanyl-D-glutamate--2,6-diaminopimelate ligase [Clostridia bacterium]